ncbi:MAG: acyl-ACP desaturase [Acidimicrobiales bacterium]|nr:acyl-ACP desaturase [Acidimicrobiales bacterium]
MSATAESLELIQTVEPDIRSLMDTHRKRREHWYAHEVVPWEQGRNYRDEPWDESQATISRPVRTALVLNLLTEDNLPYYHARISGTFPDDSAMADWSKLWTAEEGQHSIAIRDYLLTSRNCDPRSLEDDRLATVTRGWSIAFTDPVDIFNYTSAQELATRVSHRNAGVQADDPIAYELMNRVAIDENHHFMFYRGVTTAMLREGPSLVLKSLRRVLGNFSMPGTEIPNFQRRAVEIARTGIYNLRVHAEQVVQPLLRYWKIGDIGGLDAEASEAQDELMGITGTLIEQAERFEARLDRRKRT